MSINPRSLNCAGRLCFEPAQDIFNKIARSGPPRWRWFALSRFTLSQFFGGVGLGLAWSLTAVASGGEGYTESALMPEYNVLMADRPAYASGQLGVVPTTYWRAYQYLAYRALIGQPLTPADLQRVGWYEPARPAAASATAGGAVNEDASTVWFKLRASVSAAAWPKAWGVDGRAGEYDSFLNCPADAFARASATLKERQRLDAASKGSGVWLKAWLAGQDAVFTNCDQIWRAAGSKAVPPAVLPPPLPAQAPAWLVQDRAYQTAAALFYASQYPAARAQFLAIAQDKTSPWQTLSAYLAARCLLRQATLLPAPTLSATSASADPALKRWSPEALRLLGAAQQELLALAPRFAPALALSHWVEVRLHPQQRRQVLAQQLSAPKLGADAAQDLTDYLFLLDHSPRLAMMQAPEELTAWIGCMQALRPDHESDFSVDGNEAVQKRRQNALRQTAMHIARQHLAAEPAGSARALWWLPLLSLAEPGELTAAEKKASAALSAQDPGYQTVQYHWARLALQEQHPQAADALINRVLQEQGRMMSVPTRNRWLALKMLSAPTPEGFLAAAPRQVAMQQEVPLTENQPAAVARGAVVDGDFVRRLYHDVPVADLLAWRNRPDFPAMEKTRLTEVVFTRAVLLGDYATASALADDLAQGRASTRHLYQRLQQARTPEEKKLAAMLILVNTPELSPQVTQDDGTTRAWGCLTWVESEPWRLDSWRMLGPAFLTPAQKKQAQLEQKKWLALPVRSAYLAGPILAWAKQKPADPEAAKALHFLVAATRLECPGGDARLPESTEYKAPHSREAYQLLHQLYPQSEWAKKTKYYF